MAWHGVAWRRCMSHQSSYMSHQSSGLVVLLAARYALSPTLVGVFRPLAEGCDAGGVGGAAHIIPAPVPASAPAPAPAPAKGAAAGRGGDGRTTENVEPAGAVPSLSVLLLYANGRAGVRPSPTPAAAAPPVLEPLPLPVPPPFSRSRSRACAWSWLYLRTKFCTKLSD